MKKLWFLLFLGLTAQAQAGETLISKQLVAIDVDVSTTSIRWSAGGYSFPVVKILVPGLAGPTVMDHRNFGEDAPCMASYGAREIDEIIQGRPGIEKVDFNIQLVKRTSIDATQNKCYVYLIEKIEANIRGFKFEHERMLNVGERHVDDCKE